MIDKMMAKNEDASNVSNKSNPWFGLYKTFKDETDQFTSFEGHKTVNTR